MSGLLAPDVEEKVMGTAQFEKFSKFQELVKLLVPK